MSRPVDTDLLTSTAHQALVAFAVRQLDSYRQTLTRWQAQATRETGASRRPHVRRELAYYTQQVTCWEDHLGHLRSRVVMEA